MSTIIVCTDFSYPSKNALTYICKLIQEKERWNDLKIKLLHIFDLPTSYSGEGIALTTIPHEMEHAEEQLNDELDWVNAEYPQISVEAELVTGNIHESLLDQVAELTPSLVVIGAGGRYSDLLSWDKEILGFIRDLPAPILVVPVRSTSSTIKKIAFACNLLHHSDKIPFKAVKKVIEITEAQLHILFVTTPSMDKKPFIKQNEQIVYEQLQEIKPDYHTIHETNIVRAISQFIKNEQIDLLCLAPRKHGTWQALFQRDNAGSLVKLDALPILALRS